MIKKIQNMKLSELFLCSAIFFILASLFGAFDRKIYNMFWFVIFYVFELLFFLGLKSGGLVLKKTAKPINFEFKITKSGSYILVALNIISILSFVYFLVLYLNNVGTGYLGKYTSDIFDDNRTVLEKATLLLMQLGGEATYLITCICPKYNPKLKRLASVCLFLPGLRSLILGNRFTVAVEFIIYFFTYFDYQKMISFKTNKDKRKTFFVIVFGAALFAAFMYLFASRSIYFTALNLYEFVPGDMKLKSFWLKLYQYTNGKLDFIYRFFDYISEAPYVFSYFCSYKFPEKILYGQITFRAIMQLVNNAFGIGNSYTETISMIASGKYSGFGYILIADFGIYLAPVCAYLFGLLFAKIEFYRNKILLFYVIYPVTKAICLFAPIFYFYVGRSDYVILLAILLTPFCTEKIKTISCQ